MLKKIFSIKKNDKEDEEDEDKKNLINEEKKEGVDGQKPADLDKKPTESEKIIEMKKGDYSVHILIEEVKNLISIENNQPPVPRVKMIVFGKEQRTSKMKNPCDNCVFNEHYYFDKTNLTAEMLDSEKIIIEVYDNLHTDKKDYFGIYEIDFAYVYGKPNHALNNIWIGLSNTESEDMSQIRGYLKLSVSVLHVNDNRVELEPKEDDTNDCLIPIQIKMKYKQISFYFYRGEEFPDMDAVFSEKKKGRRCDGYIEMKYMGIMRKTRVVPMKNEVIIWNQIIDIPATNPCVSQKICIVVKDEDDIFNDDIVGSYEFNINDIYNGLYKDFRYINIYGSPLNKKGGIYDQMNYNAEIGSRWNGRILMKCEVSDVDSPIARVREMEKEKLLELKELQYKFNWIIKARIISAFFLPELDREYAVEICIQDNSKETQKKGTINGSVDFNESLEIQFNSLDGNLLSLPDIFVYLVDPKQSADKRRICFQRIKASEFHLNKDVLYLKFLPDPAIKKVSSMMKSGILKCKICLYNPQIDNKLDLTGFELDGADKFKFRTIESGGTFNNQQIDLSSKKHTIVAVVYMSRGLVCAESNRASDPFVTLTLGSQTEKTSVKNNTMNGVWNEKLVFNDVYMDFEDQTTWPVFLLNVYDFNKILSDVPLGYNYIWLCNANYHFNNFELVKPKWHHLFLPQSNKKQGEILISFYIFNKKIDIEKDELIDKIKFRPPTTLYNFEINVLGLRQLKPLGLIEVKKPFIRFDLNSLNVTGDVDDENAPIQTIPVNGGSDPTINTVIQFQTKLPTDIDFMPDFQCEVYDNILSLSGNSLLGIFSFNLSKLIEKTKIQVNEDIDEANINNGMTFARQFILGQIGQSLLDNNINNNIIKNNEGMREDDNIENINKYT